MNKLTGSMPPVQPEQREKDVTSPVGNAPDGKSYSVVWDVKRGGWAISKKTEASTVKQLKDEIKKTQTVIGSYSSPYGSSQEAITSLGEWGRHKIWIEKELIKINAIISEREPRLAVPCSTPKSTDDPEKILEDQKKKLKLEGKLQQANAAIQGAEQALAMMHDPEVLRMRARLGVLEHIQACLTELRSSQVQEEEKTSSYSRVTGSYNRESLYTGQKLED